MQTLTAAVVQALACESGAAPVSSNANTNAKAMRARPFPRIRSDQNHGWGSYNSLQKRNRSESDQIGLSLPSPPRLHVSYGYWQIRSDQIGLSLPKPHASACGTSMGIGKHVRFGLGASPSR